jgi:hypothetical protein
MLPTSQRNSCPHQTESGAHIEWNRLPTSTGIRIQNILKVTTTLGISLSTLFQDIEKRAQIQPGDTATLKTKFRKMESKSAQ